MIKLRAPGKDFLSCTSSLSNVSYFMLTAPFVLILLCEISAEISIFFDIKDSK